jgi:hypothetical protein
MNSSTRSRGEFVAEVIGYSQAWPASSVASCGHEFGFVVSEGKSMLVITRRPGESLLIGDSIELNIVDIDWRTLETRCALSVIDQQGEELWLRCEKRRDGVALVRVENAGLNLSSPPLD